MKKKLQKPSLAKIGIKPRGKINFVLEDGRIVTVSKNFFPELKKLSEKDLKNWQILDDQYFTFFKCDEIFHVSQLLGTPAPTKCV